MAHVLGVKWISNITVPNNLKLRHSEKAKKIWKNYFFDITEEMSKQVEVVAFLENLNFKLYFPKLHIQIT